MSQKLRLDALLVKKGLYSSREKAKGDIMAGNVYIESILMDKPGTQVYEQSEIIIKQKAIPYVSRGGLKLEKALKFFDVDVVNKVVIDAGASTGGFTDCLLKNGAKKVYAVDVGYGQLDYGLRIDERVVVLERKNVRYLNIDDIGEKADIITADLSFISLSKVFNSFFQLLKDDGQLITLIKPQFEVGKGEVGKKGVVRDPKLHVKAIKDVFNMAESENFIPYNLTFSPITGPKGNIEFLACFKRVLLEKESKVDIEQIVKDAHFELS